MIKSNSSLLNATQKSTFCQCKEVNIIEHISNITCNLLKIWNKHIANPRLRYGTCQKFVIAPRQQEKSVVLLPDITCNNEHIRELECNNWLCHI